MKGLGGGQHVHVDGEVGKAQMLAYVPLEILDRAMKGHRAVRAQDRVKKRKPLQMVVVKVREEFDILYTRFFARALPSSRNPDPASTITLLPGPEMTSRQVVLPPTEPKR